MHCRRYPRTDTFCAALSLPSAVAMYHSCKEIAAAFRVSGSVAGKAGKAVKANGKKTN